MTTAVYRGPARRQEPGREGAPLGVVTNTFKVLRVPRADWYHYDVFVKTDGKTPTIGRRRGHQLIYNLQLSQPQVFTSQGAYDGKKNIYFSRSIPSGVYDAVEDERGPPQAGGVKLQIKLTQVAKFSAQDVVKYAQEGKQDVINMLQIVLRQLPNIKFHTPAHQRNYRVFYMEENKSELGLGLEAWRGIFQSVRPTLAGLTINVDISTGVMYRGGDLPTLLMQRFDIRNLRHLELGKDSPLWSKIRQFLRGLLITWRPNQERRRPEVIDGIVERAGLFVFEKKGEVAPEQMTVETYYKQTHNIQLAYPRSIGVKNKKGTVVPIELCFVLPGQLLKGKLPEVGDISRKLLDFANRKPHLRLNEIKAGISPKTLSYGEANFVRESGMQIDLEPSTVGARRLPAPRIRFHGSEVETNTGSWNMARPQRMVFQPATAPHWVAISFVQQDVTPFIRLLLQCLRALGLTVSDNPTFQQATGQNAMPTLSKVAGEKPSFVLAILPESAAEIRTLVKQWGDMMQTIPTQCCRIDKCRNANNQYCNNVALKINAKLGGVNSVPQAPVMSEWLVRVPTMVVGADIGHPGPGVQNRPSVAALVGSVDQHASRYTYAARAQKPRQERIEDLAVMMTEILKDFWGRSRVYPERIIFFRDGVSEGEFDKVAQAELEQIRSAFNYLAAQEEEPHAKMKKMPTVTYIVVGKRHHIRFFPRQGDQMNTSKSGNCQPGLVVDSEMTSPIYFDYFLQSQAGLQGTSRPSHYTVLHDENSMTSDMLQALSFALCHVYASATSSVSIPTPVYYADKLCAHVGAYHFNPGVLGSALASEGATTTSNPEDSVDVALWNKALGRCKMRPKLFFL
ncbi:Piwi-domain-containing protein [Obba rivulosa]|uniref:Piwi-domain-containing protein n=1 Tax=Obba rivulosa TaxID=1052685 RepID=A0A8E2ARD7_9APHY|nr:Piwi-domain-containing protein [Obba rivulosa]